MRKILIFIALLSFYVSHSQVKIDSLGFHLGDNGYYLIESPKKSANDLYVKMTEYLNSPATEGTKTILEEEHGKYIRFAIDDDFMAYYRRNGRDGYIGHNSVFKIEFKEGRCRILVDQKPKFRLVIRGIKDKSEVQEKKKKEFVIIGGGNSLYHDDMVIRNRTTRNLKTDMVKYYDFLMKEIKHNLTTGSNDW